MSSSLPRLRTPFLALIFVIEICIKIHQNDEFRQHCFENGEVKLKEMMGLSPHTHNLCLSIYLFFPPQIFILLVPSCWQPVSLFLSKSRSPKTVTTDLRCFGLLSTFTERKHESTLTKFRIWAKLFQNW